MTGAARLGDEFDPFVKHADNPYRVFALARVQEPVFYSPRLDAWLVTRFDDIRDVLLDPQTFSSKNSIPAFENPIIDTLPDEQAETVRMGRALVVNDPPAHTRLRKIFAQAFTPARVAAMEPMVRSVADSLIDSFVDGRTDLVEEFSHPLPLAVILKVFGVPEADLEDCRRWAQDMIMLNVVEGLTTEQSQSALSGALAFNEYAERLVAERAAEPREDLISHVLTASIGEYEPLEQDEVVTMLPGFIIAGYETTGNLLGNLLWVLLSKAGIRSGLRDDPALISTAVEEALRRDTPVRALGRTTTRDVEIHRVHIPAGAQIMVVYASGNRDESHFADPDEFRLDRGHGLQHLAFGRGIHYCMGAQLGRLEAHIAVERLLTRLPDMRLPDLDFIPERHLSFIFHGPRSLPVVWDTRLA